MTWRTYWASPLTGPEQLPRAHKRAAASRTWHSWQVYSTEKYWDKEISRNPNPYRNLISYRYLINHSKSSQSSYRSCILPIVDEKMQQFFDMLFLWAGHPGKIWSPQGQKLEPEIWRSKWWSLMVSWVWHWVWVPNWDQHSHCSLISLNLVTPCCRYKIIKMYKFKSLLHPAPPLLRQRCRVDVPRDHRDPKRQSWLRGGTSDQYREAWPCSAVSSGERVKLVKATIKAFWADYVGVWIAAYSKHLITQHPSSSGNYERTSIQQVSAYSSGTTPACWKPSALTFSSRQANNVNCTVQRDQQGVNGVSISQVPLGRAGDVHPIREASYVAHQTSLGAPNHCRSSHLQVLATLAIARSAYWGNLLQSML